MPVDAPGIGPVTGDIAWGGNWFFLVGDHGQALDARPPRGADRLRLARPRRASSAQGITGANGGEIDHIELFGPPTAPGADSKNFVLCPGKAYDRSPCGTGTSAKLACLYADGKLQPGEVWRQESIVGSVFEGTVSVVDGQVYPRDHRLGLRERRGRPDPRRARSLLLRNPRRMRTSFDVAIAGGGHRRRGLRDGVRRGGARRWRSSSPARSAAALPRPAWATSS